MADVPDPYDSLPGRSARTRHLAASVALHSSLDSKSVGAVAHFRLFVRGSGTTYATIRAMPSVVLDTSVLVSALRSQRGASFEIVAALGRGEFDVSVSVALLLEYEATLLRHADELNLSAEDALGVVDYVCEVAIAHDIFFLWRPFLRDAGDDLVLEIAVAAGSDAIVNHNVRDFSGVEKFGVRVLTPKQFLHELRGP